jgi:hypothetical protein
VSERELAEYIVRFLEDRNGGELAEALDSQTVASRRLMIGELELILKHKGKPPSWS